ncbi:hypothetical protein IQ226_19045 [Dolichospermum sp. LEGE 00240]|uniref:hypothetical protein n=1 Tax=Dolichospermum sp. LEGE 00240 TaxID=1828603 RepID=UPI00187F1D2D|nr:hypothetical protein [Dolichospermum sp. LEGE 00240]MBE9251189.1 hypothetical protein [Dolichospermum sp. LEGE 00240]MDM3845308.1 hypothetical protein [Aphanizomenon gracile PMC638.10]MDM3849736.1 hypothetical protein [Aphanizomenon gracile PMC627.10]
MLKIRTFILALTLTPLLAINWQQPSQSQTSPSLGTAGGMSGGGNIGPINTSPSVGTGGGISGGGTTGSNGNTNSNPDDNTSPSVGTGGSMSGGGTTGSGNTSPSVGNAGGQSGSPVTIVRTSRGNSLRITAERQDKLNRVAINIFTKENSKVLVAFRQPEAIRRGESNRFTEILRQAGVSPALAGRFIFTLIKITTPASSPTTQSSSSVQLPKKYLVASTKALKFSPIIAQSADATLASVDVDINDLHNAITIYNQIIQESSPVTLQQLSQNQDFVEIGKVLKELRAAVN